MSKDGSRPRAVRLSSDGYRHTLIVDGVDLSHGVRSAQLTLASGELPTLAIDPIIFRLDEVDLQAAQAVIPEHTAQRLIALGWTPPSEGEAQPNDGSHDGG
ncbi:hypothetical protein [Streptomyces griseofuscus]|uniref:hypothetical protein n=1 Tax=Streptomyces griseofuscus TaxID=146922 RepID=UPI0033FC02CC